MLDEDDDFGDVDQNFVQHNASPIEYVYNYFIWIVSIFDFFDLTNLLCSDNSESAVVVHPDPQNDSVLLYDEISGGLRPLKEGEEF